MTQGLQSGFLGFDLKAQKAAIWDDGETLYSATNQQDVGKDVAAVLQHPAETANQYLYVHTATVSQKRILQALEKASGNKWSTNNFTSEGQIADGRKKVSEGDFSGMFNLISDIAAKNCASDIEGVAQFCVKNYISIMTIANKRDRVDLLKAQVILNLVTVILSLFVAFEFIKLGQIIWEKLA